MRIIGRAILALALAFGPAALAQSPAYRLVHSDTPLRDRDAYLFTLIDRSPKARAAVLVDPDLAAVAARIAATRTAVWTLCRGTQTCPIGDLRLSDAEIDQAGRALAKLAAPGGALNPLVTHDMRPSGLYQKYQGLTDAELMRSAFVETARGINRLYRVYALGEKPRYPAIDAMGRDPKDAHFRALVMGALDVEADTLPEDADQPFYAAWLATGLDLLVIDQRDNAARFEPWDAAENAAAAGRARTLKWARFPYTAIIVPGEGLEAGETGLSPAGLFRVRLALKRWREKKAPYLLVSGGYVHPDRTPYAEAIEMKRALVRDFGVPEAAVIVDPYARHTTTNLRNAARLLFRLGAPKGRPVLVTTSRDQSLYIGSDVFTKRNTEELGYQPLTDLKRLSPNDIEGRINLFSLHADPTDPLDP